MIVLENEKERIVHSTDYNTYFNKENGFFARWGESKEDDPVKAPMPEIADIEISSGRCHNNCPFCYKSNSAGGELHNMTFHEFRKVFHKIAKTVTEIKFLDHRPAEIEVISDIDVDTIYKDCMTKQDIIDKNLEYYDPESVFSIQVYNQGLLNQIAFGITSPYDNPDFFRMMEYARAFDVIPNYTIKAADVSEEVAEQTVRLCGACAISLGENREQNIRAIKLLQGIEQLNIHQVAMNTTYDKIIEFLELLHNRNDLSINALVLLKYKPKGTNAGKFKPLSKEQYKNIFNLASEYGIGIGFDSCSAPVYLDMIKDSEKASELSMYAEPCESTLFSVYVNSHCETFPCSFAENESRDDEDWTTGINLLEIKDFQKEVWNSERVEYFRNKLLEHKRHCPMFSLEE
jgi:hypothetical protein